jgi:GR25 family glycosyltransferase involved in LPS biosynthesis
MGNTRNRRKAVFCWIKNLQISISMLKYYINLDRSTDRRAAFERNLRQTGLLSEFQRFSAVDGSKLIRTNQEWITNGEWGCYQSHMQLLKSCVGKNQDVMILEDDECFDNNLRAIFVTPDNIPRSDWDIMYLDMTIMEIEDYFMATRNLAGGIQSGQLPKVVQVPPSTLTFGTHAYVINCMSVEKVYQLLETSQTRDLPIDNVYAAAVKDHTLKALMVLPLHCYPGPETANSQISGTKSEILRMGEVFRMGISLPNYFANKDNYWAELERITRQAVEARLNFRMLEKVNPDLKMKK